MWFCMEALNSMSSKSPLSPFVLSWPLTRIYQLQYITGYPPWQEGRIPWIYLLPLIHELMTGPPTGLHSWGGLAVFEFKVFITFNV